MKEIKNVSVRENGNLDLIRQKYSNKTSNKKVCRISCSLFCQCAIFVTLAITLAFSGSISTIIIHLNINVMSNDFESDNHNVLYHVTPNTNISKNSVPSRPSEHHDIHDEKTKLLKTIENGNKVSYFNIKNYFISC